MNDLREPEPAASGWSRIDCSIDEGVLEVRMKGIAKVWALKSRLRIPIECVREARHDPGAARGAWKGLRMPGTYVPGLITAGTYYAGGEKVFWYVRRPEGAVVVELENTSYDRLVIEVSDPASVVRLIERARAEHGVD